ncbi:retrovirus-related Pol polyprotein from transposon TNT 1-94 [Trichonephila clavipes]|nr:retrovirus-related Pol polyprotein from transposon TNT 1-94 [Trichonephila clavipes]
MEKLFRSDELKDDIVSHISKLQRNFSELNDELRRVAKTTLPDLLLMSRIMSTLPSEYFEFKSVWESVPIEERSVNKLTERLRLIEMRLPSKSADSTALVATRNKICDGCCYGKQCRRPFGTRKQRATTPGELININICGPMQQQSLGGAKFYLCFKDDFTKYRRVFFMQSKNGISKCLETFLNEAKHARHMVKEVLSDGGGEVINSTVKSTLEKFGISSRMSMHYTPQQNGAAECENGTIVESERSIIYTTNLPLKLGAEAVNTSVYVLNRTCPTSVKDRSPYELWFSKEVISIDLLRVFGAECFVHVSQQKRRKWDKECQRIFCWLQW